MHAVWAARNLLQESVAGGGASPMLSDFFVHKRWGPTDSWILLLKYCYKLEKASREIGQMRVQWVQHIHISNGNARIMPPTNRYKQFLKWRDGSSAQPGRKVKM
jgi:hypothetical protein